jgi:hypothetical protein
MPVFSGETRDGSDIESAVIEANDDLLEVDVGVRTREIQLSIGAHKAS